MLNHSSPSLVDQSIKDNKLYQLVYVVLGIVIWIFAFLFTWPLDLLPDYSFAYSLLQYYLFCLKKPGDALFSGHSYTVLLCYAAREETSKLVASLMVFHFKNKESML